MGGLVHRGVGGSCKSSPRRAPLEKARAELRHEYDVREERRRQLDYLAKGGNPLDFRLGHTTSVGVQSASLTGQHPEEVHPKVVDTAHEDSILEECCIIEAKRKRFAECHGGDVPLENRRRAHWDFVLEEMAWLANDFLQERRWKITAAAQVCHQIASEHFTEENLFYVVPPGSMGTYRESAEHHFLREHSRKLHSRKRPSSCPVNAGGSSEDRVGQHVSKKHRIARQALDSSFNSHAPISGTCLSPLASHKGKRGKSSKTPASQPGLESEWSVFENQALAVLVNDLGPNWELISDAINSTFKRIFRKSNECKEQYNVLISNSAGNGTDNAEKCGPSQLYPSTSPDVPKGRARLLLQCLPEPKKEDDIKSHFEKIISISQKSHGSRTKVDDGHKKLIQPHHSHELAFSEVCLTPLDICDTSISDPDSPVSDESKALQGSLKSSAYRASIRGIIDTVFLDHP